MLRRYLSFIVSDIGDVAKQQDLSGFYRHLYQTTVGEEDSKDKKKDTEHSSSDESKNKSIAKQSEGRSTDEPIKHKKSSKKGEKQSRSYRKRNRSESLDEETDKTRGDKKQDSETPKKKKKTDEIESTKQASKGEFSLIRLIKSFIYQIIFLKII